MTRNFQVAEDVAAELVEQVAAWVDGRISSAFLLEQAQNRLSQYEGHEVKVG